MSLSSTPRGRKYSEWYYSQTVCACIADYTMPYDAEGRGMAYEVEKGVGTEY